MVYLARIRVIQHTLLQFSQNRIYLKMFLYIHDFYFSFYKPDYVMQVMAQSVIVPFRSLAFWIDSGNTILLCMSTISNLKCMGCSHLGAYVQFTVSFTYRCHHILINNYQFHRVFCDGRLAVDPHSECGNIDGELGADPHKLCPARHAAR